MKTEIKTAIVCGIVIIIGLMIISFSYNEIDLKRNTTNTTAPTTSDIDIGELAISAVDGKIYLRKTDNAIVAQAIKDDVIALAIALG